MCYVKDNGSYTRFRDVLQSPVKFAYSFTGCVVNGYRFKCCDLNDLTSTNWKKLLFLIIQVVIRFLLLSVIGLIPRRVSKLIIIGCHSGCQIEAKV